MRYSQFNIPKFYPDVFKASTTLWLHSPIDDDVDMVNDASNSTHNVYELLKPS